MRIYPFTLAAVLALAIAIPSRAAEKPRPAQGNQNQSKKVWTNEDLDELHSRGLISIVGPEVTEAPAQPAVTPSEPAFPVYNSRLEDPEWYAEKAADLQAELDARSCFATGADSPRASGQWRHPAGRGDGPANDRRDA